MSDRSFASIPFLLAALLAAPATAHAAAASPAPARIPVFLPDTTVVEATPELQWAVAFRVKNTLDGGLYLDSLLCDVQDLDPGETREARSTTLDASGVVRLTPSLSIGEETNFQYVGPALAEHARLTFRLKLHGATAPPMTLTTVVEAMPGQLSRDNPSQFLDVGGHKVEYLLVRAGRSSAPGVLLVHGHGNNARKMLRGAMALAQRGYTVMLVSQPGYGLSEGPADMMGPATIRALSAALDKLKSTTGVDSSKLGAWGVSRGATCVTLLAQQRNDLSAVISQAGIYDLWAAYRGTRIQGIRDNMVAEVGSDSAAWRARSAALNPVKPRAAFLILHGESDPNVPVEQAKGFVETLKSRGVEVESQFFPGAQHMLPRGETMRLALDFLKRRIGP